MVVERTRLFQHTLEGYGEPVEHVHEMIFSCDRGGVITSVNTAAADLPRRSEGTIVGVTSQTIVSPVPVELRLLALPEHGRPVGSQGIARRWWRNLGSCRVPAAAEAHAGSS
jgi:PAS domain-containing protein